MKTTLKHLILIMSALALPVSLTAEQSHDHGDHGHDHGSHGADHLPKVPGTVPGAWGTLQEHFGKIKTAVKAGDHGTIHNSEPIIQACLKVLSEKSVMVEEKNQTRLLGALKQAAKAGDTVHHAADEGNKEAMTKGVKQLEGILKLIAAQYPEGTLKPKE